MRRALEVVGSGVALGVLRQRQVDSYLRGFKEFAKRGGRDGIDRVEFSRERVKRAVLPDSSESTVIA